MHKLVASLRFLSAETSNLERAVSILAGSALLSSLLALFRDRLLAHTFGAGVELDLYYAAFRVPDLLFVTIGALVSVYILIPELARRGTSGEKDYIDTIVAGFSLLAVFVSGLVALFAPTILSSIFPAFVENGQLPTLVLLTRIMLLQPILLGLSNILAAVTQIRTRYTLYALCPILYNTGIIVGIIFFYPLFGLSGLAWGVVLGATLHLSIQLPSIIRDGFFRRLPWIREPSSLITTALISVPRSLALSVNQIAFVGLTALAATLSPGSVAVFMFAFNLQSVPLAVIGASYSVAAFPTLAAAHANGKSHEFIRHVTIAARHVIFWSIPALALIIVLRAHIVRVVLGSGGFDWTDTRLTAACVAVLSLAILSQGLTLLLVRGYYAAGRTFVPFFVALGSATGTLLLAVLYLSAFGREGIVLFMETMLRVENLEGTAVLALTLAFTTMSILSTIMLAILFEIHFGRFFGAVRRTFFESLAAALTGAFVAYATLAAIGELSVTSTLGSVFLRGFFGGTAGLAAIAAVYWIIGNREFSETIAALWAKFVEGPRERIEVVAPSAEDIGPSRSQ